MLGLLFWHKSDIIKKVRKSIQNLFDDLAPFCLNQTSISVTFITYKYCQCNTFSEMFRDFTEFLGKLADFGLT